MSESRTKRWAENQELLPQVGLIVTKSMVCPNCDGNKTTHKVISVDVVESTFEFACEECDYRRTGQTAGPGKFRYPKRSNSYITQWFQETVTAPLGTTVNTELLPKVGFITTARMKCPGCKQYSEEQEVVYVDVVSQDFEFRCPGCGLERTGSTQGPGVFNYSALGFNHSTTWAQQTTTNTTKENKNMNFSITASRTIDGWVGLIIDSETDTVVWQSPEAYADERDEKGLVTVAGSTKATDAAKAKRAEVATKLFAS